jgi:methylated-DNA-[protein]-cysteine S-methyltransferase
VELLLDEMPSPIGTIAVVSSQDALCALDFADCRERMLALLRSRYGAVRLVRTTDPCGIAGRLRAYFDGDLRALDDVPVDLHGTAFQQRVWSCLRSIPAGSTRSYGELAMAIGQPSAARAVGTTNGRNPIALVVPCHRVVGQNGQLTGYAGGLHRKRWLLAHEGVELPLAAPSRRC